MYFYELLIMIALNREVVFIDYERSYTFDECRDERNRLKHIIAMTGGTEVHILCPRKPTSSPSDWLLYLQPSF